MGVLSKEEMKKYIVSVLSEFHDYIPATKLPVDENDIIGCINTLYHNGKGESLIYPPITETGGVSVVTPTVAYLLTRYYEIYVVTDDMTCINIESCLANSYELVFAMIRDLFVNELQQTKNRQ